jgi:thiamine transport system substrate-binding protein
LPGQVSYAKDTIFKTASPQFRETLSVMTHDSFNASQDVIASFEKESKVKVRFPKSGYAGAALVQAILSKENPLADLFYGVDNTFLSRAIKADIFESYASPMLGISQNSCSSMRRTACCPSITVMSA